jgi:hypothetical protein
MVDSCTPPRRGGPTISQRGGPSKTVARAALDLAPAPALIRLTGRPRGWMFVREPNPLPVTLVDDLAFGWRLRGFGTRILYDRAQERRPPPDNRAMRSLRNAAASFGL